MGDADSRSLRSDSYVRMRHFCSSNYFCSFSAFFAGDVRRDVFVMFFMVLLVPISATHRKMAVLMLWDAFPFLGRRFFLCSSFYLVVSGSPLIFL
jgi:hypothetical protein